MNTYACKVSTIQAIFLTLRELHYRQWHRTVARWKKPRGLCAVNYL